MNLEEILFCEVSSGRVAAAYVAAAGSILATLISICSALITLNASSRTKKEIVLLKHRLQYGTATQEFLDKELEASLIALNNASKTLQYLKDTISILINNSRQFRAHYVISRLDGSLIEIENSFRENHPDLNDDEQLQLHAAKSDSFLAIPFLKEALVHFGEKTFDLSEYHRNYACKFKDKLSEAQTRLSGYKAARIQERVLPRS